jgi:hypothetical protein
MLMVLLVVDGGAGVSGHDSILTNTNNLENIECWWIVLMELMMSQQQLLEEFDDQFESFFDTLFCCWFTITVRNRHHSSFVKWCSLIGGCHNC